MASRFGDELAPSRTGSKNAPSRSPSKDLSRRGSKDSVALAREKRKSKEGPGPYLGAPTDSTKQFTATPEQAARDNQLDQMGHRPALDRGPYGSKTSMARPSKEGVPNIVVQRGSKDVAQDAVDNANARKASKDLAGLERRGSKDSVISMASQRSADPRYNNRRRSVNEVIAEEIARNPGKRSKAVIDRAFDPERFSDRRFLDDMFLCYDPNEDGTGSLGPKEFASLCKDIGLELNKSDVKGLMKQLDLNGNGTIEIEEFHFFFNRAKTRDDIKKQASGMVGSSKNELARKMYEEFGNPNNKGIDKQGLKQMVRVCGLDKDPEMVSEEEIKGMFKRLDKNKSGYITQDDVLFLLSNIEARPQLKEWLKVADRNNETVLKEVFKAFDSSQRGQMTDLDLLAAARFLGLKINEDGMDALLSKVDSDRNGIVDIGEFEAFFGQVRSTEEMMDELKHFGMVNSRRKYVFYGGMTLGGLCLLGGVIMIAASVDAGVALLVCGLMIVFTLMFPTFIWPFLLHVVFPALSDCSTGKVVTIIFLNAFGLMGLIAWMALQPEEAGAGAIIGIAILGATLAAELAMGIFYWVCMKQGWFNAPENDEDLSPTTAGSPGMGADPFSNLPTGSPGSKRGSKDVAKAGSKSSKRGSKDAYAPTVDLEANQSPRPRQAF